MPGYGFSRNTPQSAGVAIPEVERMNRRLQLLAKFTPELRQDPTAAFSLASAQTSDDDLMKAALQTAGFVDVQSRVKDLQESPDDYQRAHYNSLPKEMQKKYRQAGFAPPERDSGDDNGWFKVNLPKLPGFLGGFDLPEIGPGDGIAAATGAIAAPIAFGMNAVGAGIEAMGTMPRAISRLYRTLEYAEDRNGNAFSGLGRAWKAVEKGELTFYKSAEERALNQLNGNEDMFELAKLTASGSDPMSFEEVAEKRFRRDSPEFGQEVLRLYELSQEKSFIKAQRTLRLGMMSLGRSLADAVTTPGTKSYNLISGSVDGGLQLVDPGLLLGGSSAAFKAARWGRVLDGAEGIDRVREFKAGYQALKSGQQLKYLDRTQAEGVGRVADRVAEQFSKVTRTEDLGDWDKLSNELPQLVQSLDRMHRWHAAELSVDKKGLGTGDGFFDFLESDEGWKALNTNLGGFGKNRYHIPHVTAAGQAKIRAKEFFRRNIDDLITDPDSVKELKKLVEAGDIQISPRLLDLLEGDDEVSKAVDFLRDHWIGKPIVAGAQLTRGILQHAPRGKDLDLHGDQAVAGFTRLAETGVLAGLPPRLVKDYINEFAAGGTTGQRHLIARTFFSDMFSIAGASDEFAARYTGKSMKYGLAEGADNVIAPGIEDPFKMALWPGVQESYKISIPNIREMAKDIQRYNFMGGLIGKTPVRYADSFMGRYWTPSVLLRIGFIPRAFGEELFNTLLREGLQPMMEARVSRWVADGRGDQKTFQIKDRKFSSADILDRADLRALDDAGPMRQMYEVMTRSVADDLGINPFEAGWDLAKGMATYRAARLFDYGKGGMLAPFRATQKGLTNVGQAAGYTTEGKIMAGQMLRVIDVPKENLQRFLDENPQLVEAAGFIESLKMREFVEMTDAKNSTQASSGYFRDDLMDIQKSRSITIRSGKGEFKDVELVPKSSDFKPHILQDAEYFSDLVRLYQRDVRSPFKAAAIRAIDDVIDPRTAERIQGAVAGTRFAGADAAESVENVRRFFRQTGRAPSQRKYLRGDGNEDFGKYLENLMKREGNEDLVAFLKRANDDSDIGAIFRSRNPQAKARLQGDDEDLLQTIANSILDEMYRPENARALASSARTVVSDQARVRVPVADGQARTYTPVASDEVYAKFTIADNVRKFQDNLRVELERISKGDLYDNIVDFVVPGPDLGLKEVRTSRAAITQHEFKPVSAWVSTNPEVARAVSKALHEAAGVTDEIPMIGFKDVTEEALMMSRKDLKPLHGLRQTGDGNWERALSFFADQRHLSLVEPINYDEFTHLLKVREADGTVRWMDKVEYDTLAAKIEAQGDDVYAGALKVPRSGGLPGAEEFDLRRLPTLLDEGYANGISMESATRAWANDQARDILTQYTSKDERLLHELIEPSAAGDIGPLDVKRTSLDSWPEVVYGPEMVVPEPLGAWDKVVRFGFDKVIGRAGAAIIRNDMFVHYVGRAIDDLKPEAMRRFLNPDLHNAVQPLVKKLKSADTEVLSAWAKLPDWAKKSEADPVRVNERLQENLGLIDPIFEKKWTKTAFDENGKPIPVKVYIRTYVDEDGVVQKWTPDLKDIEPNIDHGLLRAVKEMRKNGEEPPNPYDLQARDLSDMRAWTKNIENYEETFREAVVSQAFNEVAPFIDDRRFRSQFQENVGSFIPFMFAEEQFLKRWGRTLTQNPDAAYKAILTMNGLRATGVIKEDPLTGEDIFVYPGSSQLTQVLSKTASFIFGKQINIPFAPAFGGQVKYTMPGLDGGVPGVPAVGPLVGIGLTGLAHVLPEASGLKNWTLGEQAEGRQWWSFLVPASLDRAWDFIAGDDEQMASAMIQAMAYLEANGHAPPDGASTREIEEYQERVSSQARVILGTRFIYGFSGPASPKMLAPDAELNAELQELMRSGAPVDEAIGAYLKANPDADPYTVFKTEVVSGAPLSQTEEAFQWMNDNDEYLKTFPMAAPYLMPQERSETFERRAYFDQLARGMRIRRSPDEWYEEMKFAKAADLYFESMDNYEAEVLAVGDDTQARKALRDSWDFWKESYFNQHPLFAEMLRDPSKQQRRVKILDEMRLIVKDPDAPTNVDPMRTLLESYDKFKETDDALKGDRRGAIVDYRKALKDDFSSWAFGYTKQNPGVRAFFQRVMGPELDLDFESMGAQAA